MASSLDCYGQGSLMLCAGASFAAGLDLASLRQVPAESRHVFVIHFADSIHAEIADLAA
ncbi:hypothetical protein BH23CHL5_BH23CHL5_12330 [soil metagenome]